MKLFNLKSIQFSQIFTDIDNFLSASEGPIKRINKNTIFGQLMTVLSGLYHNIMLYIEDAFVEQNKYSAQRKKSILALAAQSGYRPSYGMAAGCWIRISPLAQVGGVGNLIIPKRQRVVCSANGLYYYLLPPNDYLTIENQYVDIFAIQGKFERQAFVVPEGRNLYAQNLKFVGYIDERYIEVKVNGVEWKKKDSFYDLNKGEQGFVVRYNPTDGIDLLFGDGYRGQPIQSGDRIEVSYLLHDGEVGNIDPNKNPIFAFDGPMLNSDGEEVDGNTMVRMALRSGSSIVSGSNPESLSHVREMIGFNTRSLVLSDSNAYKVWLSQFSFVGYNRTWSEEGTTNIRSLIMKNFRQKVKSGSDYFDLGKDDFILDSDQKNALQNSIVESGKMLIGSTYEIVDVQLKRYSLSIHVTMKKGVVGGEVDKVLIEKQIREIVGNFFCEPQSDFYIPKSDIVELIKSRMKSVDGVDLYFLSEENEKAKVEHQYIKNGQTIIVDKKEDPRIGLDDHGNILLEGDDTFPVLMGGWSVNGSKEDTYQVEPISITVDYYGTH